MERRAPVSSNITEAIVYSSASRPRTPARLAISSINPVIFFIASIAKRHFDATRAAWLERTNDTRESSCMA